MIREGALENPEPEVIFGLHVNGDGKTGTISYRPGGTMASVNTLSITVRGKQTHAAYPWKGIDPIVTAAQIILGLQTITSRQIDLTTAPAVVTVATIQGGVRSNIIPDEVKMTGTIRTLDPAMKKEIHNQIRRIAVDIAESAGATAEVSITGNLPITYNNPDLAERMRPSLERVVGPGNLETSTVHTGGEDFAYYAEQVPGLFIFLGVRPPDLDPSIRIVGHSPQFFVDENALIYGVRALASMTVDYLAGK